MSKNSTKFEDSFFNHPYNSSQKPDKLGIAQSKQSIEAAKSRQS